MENPNLSSSSSSLTLLWMMVQVPFFLHQPLIGFLLVSQPLTRDNYVSWSRAMVIALSVKNKLGFIDGTIP